MMQSEIGKNEERLMTNFGTRTCIVRTYFTTRVRRSYSGVRTYESGARMSTIRSNVSTRTRELERWSRRKTNFLD